MFSPRSVGQGLRLPGLSLLLSSKITPKKEVMLQRFHVLAEGIGAIFYIHHDPVEIIGRSRIFQQNVQRTASGLHILSQCAYHLIELIGCST